MAEQVVLASVTVDASGVVSGMGQANAAIGRGETALNKLKGTVIPGSTALRALGLQLGGLAPMFARLGPAALAFGAAYGVVRSLMRTEEIRAFTAEWTKLSAAWASSILEVTGLSSALKSLTGWMKSANDALAGPESFAEALKRMNLKDPREQLGDLVQILGRVNREADRGALPFYLKQIGEQAAALKKQGVSLPGVLSALVPPEAGKGKAGPAAAVPPSMFAIAGIPQADPAVFAEKYRQLTDALRFLQDQVRQGLPGGLYEVGLANIAEGFRELGYTADEVSEKMRQLGVDFEESVGSDAILSKVEMVSLAFGTLGNVINEAVATGGLTFRKFAADMLSALVPVLFGLGSALIARGILTYNPADVTAGYTAFAAGLAAGAAAAFLGRGTGTASASGGGGGGFAAAGGGGGGRRGQDITINIQGSLIGTDPDNLARDLNRLIRTAEAEGA